MGAKTSEKYIHLDLFRGVAAFMVLINHLRAIFYTDHGSAGDLGVTYDLIYFLSGFGHEAVMVFFVLSGFFISGNVLKQVNAGRWSWKHYLIQRGSRLWIVLVPALVFTAILDLSGMAICANTELYNGDTHNGVINYSISERSTPAIVLGNILFLQSIQIDTYGSNSPLWSLSYEFWYYILFPSLFFALRKNNNIRSRVLFLSIACIVFVLLGFKAGLYFGIWLLGFAGAVMHRRGLGANYFARHGVLAFHVVILLSALTAVRLKWLTTGGDLAVAATFLLVTLSCVHVNYELGDSYRRFCKGASAVSYTMYCFHLPFLVFINFAFMDGKRWAMGPESLAYGFGILLIALGYVVLCYNLFERWTAKARSVLADAFTPRDRSIVESA